MKKRIAIIFVLFVCLSFSACSTSVDSLDNIGTELVANAGGDQISFAGSFAVLDASKSKLPANEEISLIEWLQDPGNPEEITAFSNLSFSEPDVVGFQKEGKYKFTLKITCKSGNIYTDKFTIYVANRQKSPIDDVNLEIRIRYRLNYKAGELSQGKLLLLDSLILGDGFLALKNNITSIKGIEHCTNLKYLLLCLQGITDLTPLSNLTKLEYLDLSSNRTVSDISPIYNLTNLKELVLYSNPIKDISGIGKLTNLKKLDLIFTRVEDISSLKSLTNLEFLQLGDGGDGVTLKSLEPLSALTKLTWLSLGGCGITDIKPLENLTELDLFYLGYNKLTEIQPVSKMKKLVRLCFESNKVAIISGIKNLENLDFLDASDNQITDISELQYLTKIHLIGLPRNKIVDIKPLVDNPNLNSGVYLYLTGNPLNEKSINEYIPTLIKRGVKVYF
jgi:internalin A